MVEGPTNNAFSLSLTNGQNGLGSNFSLGLPGIQIDPSIAKSFDNIGALTMGLTGTNPAPTGTPAQNTGAGNTAGAGGTPAKSPGLSNGALDTIKGAFGLGSAIAGVGGAIAGGVNAAENADKKAESDARVAKIRAVTTMVIGLKSAMPAETDMKVESRSSSADNFRRATYKLGGPFNR